MGRINERIAEMAARAPDRFVGLGSVPLQAPTRSDRPRRTPQGHCERTDHGLFERCRETRISGGVISLSLAFNLS